MKTLVFVSIFFAVAFAEKEQDNIAAEDITTVHHLEADDALHSTVSVDQAMIAIAEDPAVADIITLSNPEDSEDVIDDSVLTTVSNTTPEHSQFGEHYGVPVHNGRVYHRFAAQYGVPGLTATRLIPAFNKYGPVSGRTLQAINTIPGYNTHAVAGGLPAYATIAGGPTYNKLAYIYANSAAVPNLATVSSGHPPNVIPIHTAANGIPVQSSANGIPVQSAANGNSVQSTANAIPIPSTANGIPVQSVVNGVPIHYGRHYGVPTLPYNKVGASYGIVAAPPNYGRTLPVGMANLGGTPLYATVVGTPSYSTYPGFAPLVGASTLPRANVYSEAEEQAPSGVSTLSEILSLLTSTLG